MRTKVSMISVVATAAIMLLGVSSIGLAESSSVGTSVLRNQVRNTARALNRQVRQARASQYIAISNSNVRAEPTTDSERIGYLTAGAAVAVVSDLPDRDWYQVEYDGKTGYVWAPLLKETQVQ